MAQAISTRRGNLVHQVIQAFMLLAGLVVVVAALTVVTKSKFDTLRSINASLDTINISVAEKTKQLDCLARNIYWEAATEPFEGKVAVAQVTLNRVEDGRFGKGVCGVVYQKNIIYEKIICQFSWVCEGKYKTKPIHERSYAESEEVAKKVLFEGFNLPSLKEAMYYHASYVRPGWKKEKIAQIGQHIFYKD